MRYPGPWSADGRGRSGPLVVPGTYQVALSVEGQEVAARQLRILIDPRVAADGVTVAHLTEQRDLALQVRDALSDARRARQEIVALEEEMRAAAGESREAETLVNELADLKAVLVPDPEISSYPPRLLPDQLEYLYGMLRRADQRPGQDAHERYRELRGRVDEVVSELERLRGRATDLEGAGD
jgi:chromosome segregation ATPase